MTETKAAEGEGLTMDAVSTQSQVQSQPDGQATMQDLMETDGKIFQPDAGNAASQEVTAKTGKPGQAKMDQRELSMTAETRKEVSVHTEVNEAAFTPESRFTDTVQIEIPQDSANPEEVLVQKLTESLQQKSAEGIQEFQISVTPKNLGDIHMKIQLVQGEMRISITCQQEKTMSLLTQHADDIARIVEQNMTNLTAQSASGQSDYLQQQSDGQQRQQQEQRQQQKKQEASEDFLQMLRLGIVTT